MKQEIKEKWVAALRSGEYSQTKNTLRDKHGFCCLGVLCDLHQKETDKCEWKSNYLGSDTMYYDSLSNLGVGVLPRTVIEWAGLDDENPIIDGDSGYAAIINDNGATFAHIADLIEKNL